MTFAFGDEVVCHPRIPFGGRSVDYRHLLLPLSRKPQALRQVVHELVAQFGDPWPALWDALCACYAPDELEAARRLAPWLERADRQGVARLGRDYVRRLPTGPSWRLRDGPPGRRSFDIPVALRAYAVESPDLSRYDSLLAPRGLPHDRKTLDLLLAAVRAQTRALKLPTVGRERDALARQALAEGWARSHTFAPRSMPSSRPAPSPPSSDAFTLPACPRERRSRNSTGDAPTDSSVPASRSSALRWIDRPQRRPARTRRHGKTHLATALGIEAIKRGHHVAFFRASDLVRALTEARDARVLSRLQDRLRRASRF